jgi:hypothetical protein
MKTQNPSTKPETRITLKKTPAKDAAIAPQAAGILAALKALSGSATPAALKEKMNSTVKTKQTMGRIWLCYRDALVKAGYVAVKGAKK